MQDLAYRIVHTDPQQVLVGQGGGMLRIERQFRRTPLRCTWSDHHYEERVLWVVHYIEEEPEPTNQVPEISAMTCRYPNCESPVEVAEGWLPY
jgi:hypothetical protein